MNKEEVVKEAMQKLSEIEKHLQALVNLMAIKVSQDKTAHLHKVEHKKTGGAVSVYPGEDDFKPLVKKAYQDHK